MEAFQATIKKTKRKFHDKCVWISGGDERDSQEEIIFNNLNCDELVFHCLSEFGCAPKDNVKQREIYIFAIVTTRKVLPTIAAPNTELEGAHHQRAWYTSKRTQKEMSGRSPRPNTFGTSIFDLFLYSPQPGFLRRLISFCHMRAGKIVRHGKTSTVR
jgi:hypothetical protein